MPWLRRGSAGARQGQGLHGELALTHRPGGFSQALERRPYPGLPFVCASLSACPALGSEQGRIAASFPTGSRPT